jgi:hypothetical protein
MASVLCFLADSPMHAEITNTPVPGNSLNPCHYCVLWSKTLIERKKMPYVTQFLQKNLHGENVFHFSFFVFVFAFERRRKKISFLIFGF